MKVFVASMIAAYAAACPCPMNDSVCWAKVFDCNIQDAGCRETADWHAAGNDDCYHKDGGEGRSPSMEDYMEEAQRQLSQWIYKDKDGKMKIKDVPDFAWNVVNEEEKEDFMRRQRERGEKSQWAWYEADVDLARALEKPWNEYVQKAEDLSKSDALGDLDADQEVANWMLDNIYIGGKTIAEQNPNQKKEWDAMRDDARREINNWSFDDLMFQMPSEKKAQILAATTGEASMQQKWEQIIQLVQKSSNFDQSKVEDMIREQAREWEKNNINGQIRNLEQAEKTTCALADFIKEHLEQVRMDAEKGLTTLTKEEHEFLDQAIKGVEEADRQVMDAIRHEIDNLQEDMRVMNDTVRNETAWNESYDNMTGGDSEQCEVKRTGETECCNEKGCYITKLSSKKGASQQESTFASSFGYGAAAGVALGAVVVYVANNKSKTADGFDRV